MNKIKMIICIISICFIGIARAQKADNQQKNQLINTEQKNSDVITFEVEIDVQKVANTLKLSVLKNEVKNQSVIIRLDNAAQTLSLSIDTMKVKLSDIKNRLHDKVPILLMPEKKNVSFDVDKPKPPVAPIEKYNPKIDQFLNIEDTTIFTSNFKIYDLQEIHLSRRNYYQVAQKIHDFGEKLKNVEDNLSNSKISEAAKYFKITEDIARKNLLESARTDIDKAEKELDGLLPFGKELDMLSSLQKQYYKVLKDKFNNLYAKINP